jgi:predicted DNA-binding antitoxin AbrB/MazE fold protein
MVHNVDAIYDHGVFRPIEPLALPEGARVHLRVEEENGRPADTPSEATDYRAWLDGLAGRWQGDFPRGDEGDFETRESLS